MSRLGEPPLVILRVVPERGAARIEVLDRFRADPDERTLDLEHRLPSGGRVMLKPMLARTGGGSVDRTRLSMVELEVPEDERRVTPAELGDLVFELASAVQGTVRRSEREPPLDREGVAALLAAARERQARVTTLVRGQLLFALLMILSPFLSWYLLGSVSLKMVVLFPLGGLALAAQAALTRH